ncbi:MAG: hypothetical protein ABIZ70_00555 [Gemmatimonadales bacterium]
MKNRLLVIGLSAIISIANLARPGVAVAQDSYLCGSGWHSYAICPNLGYCQQGADATCQQICPWAVVITGENTCNSFGNCEALTCTFR